MLQAERLAPDEMRRQGDDRVADRDGRVGDRHRDLLDRGDVAVDGGERAELVVEKDVARREIPQQMERPLASLGEVNGCGLWCKLESELARSVRVLRDLLDRGEAELQQRYAERPSTATERRGLVLAWSRKA